jgi:hypothetical protein
MTRGADIQNILYMHAIVVGRSARGRRNTPLTNKYLNGSRL